MSAAGVLQKNLEQLGACSAVEIAGVLLAFCRHRTNEWTAAFTTTGAEQAFDSARDEAAKFFSEFSGALFSKEEVNEIAEFAESLAQGTKSALLAARAMAFAFDEVFGDKFVNPFQARGATPLKADAPFPVRHHDPDFLGYAPDASPRLKLFPSASPTVPVVLSFEHASALASLPADACVAAMLPNVAAADVPAAKGLEDIKQHFEVDATVEGERFFWVRTTNDDQVERIKRLVAVAEQQGVHIALLPELCVTHEQQVELVAWLSEHRKSMFLTVGSAHSEEGGRRMNRARSFVCPGVELVHEKFNPYIFAGALHEDLRETKSEIRVYALGDLRTLVVLVCKDLLAQEVARVIADMRLWLVLVPSLSPKADDFQNIAGILATTAQTSLVAAIASFGDPTEAVVVAGRPRKAARSNNPAHRTRADLGGPALVTTRLTKVDNGLEDQGLTLIVHRLENG